MKGGGDQMRGRTSDLQLLLLWQEPRMREGGGAQNKVVKIRRPRSRDSDPRPNHSHPTKPLPPSTQGLWPLGLRSTEMRIQIPSLHPGQLPAAQSPSPRDRVVPALVLGRRPGSSIRRRTQSSGSNDHPAPRRHCPAPIFIVKQTLRLKTTCPHPTWAARP